MLRTAGQASCHAEHLTCSSAAGCDGRHDTALSADGAVFQSSPSSPNPQEEADQWWPRLVWQRSVCLSMNIQDPGESFQDTK